MELASPTMYDGSSVRVYVLFLGACGSRSDANLFPTSSEVELIFSGQLSIIKIVLAMVATPTTDNHLLKDMVSPKGRTGTSREWNADCPYDELASAVPPSFGVPVLSILVCTFRIPSTFFFIEPVCSRARLRTCVRRIGPMMSKESVTRWHDLVECRFEG